MAERRTTASKRKPSVSLMRPAAQYASSDTEEEDMSCYVWFTQRINFDAVGADGINVTLEVPLSNREFEAIDQGDTQVFPSVRDHFQRWCQRQEDELSVHDHDLPCFARKDVESFVDNERNETFRTIGSLMDSCERHKWRSFSFSTKGAESGIAMDVVMAVKVLRSELVTGYIESGYACIKAWCNRNGWKHGYQTPRMTIDGPDQYVVLGKVYDSYSEALDSMPPGRSFLSTTIGRNATPREFARLDDMRCALERYDRNVMEMVRAKRPYILRHRQKAVDRNEWHTLKATLYRLFGEKILAINVVMGCLMPNHEVDEMLYPTATRMFATWKTYFGWHDVSTVVYACKGVVESFSDQRRVFRSYSEFVRSHPELESQLILDPAQDANVDYMTLALKDDARSQADTYAGTQLSPWVESLGSRVFFAQRMSYLLENIVVNLEIELNMERKIQLSAWLRTSEPPPDFVRDIFAEWTRHNDGFTIDAQHSYLSSSRVTAFLITNERMRLFDSVSMYKQSTSLYGKAAYSKSLSERFSLL
jgi:hypothetical protein